MSAPLRDGWIVCPDWPAPELGSDLLVPDVCAHPAPVVIKVATKTDPGISHGFRFIRTPPYYYLLLKEEAQSTCQRRNSDIHIDSRVKHVTNSPRGHACRLLAKIHSA